VSEPAPRRILVAGALGVVGRAVVAHFDGRPGWQVIGLSRRTPDFETGARFLSVDLRDAAACRALRSELRGVTHLAYAALHEKPELVRGWLEEDHAETNTAMLRHLLDALDPDGLEHVALLQGTKAYGFHAGRPLRTPYKEDAPRADHTNFYFRQEDLLRARAERAGFATTVLRPQVVCGVAVGSAMNLVATLGVYASVLRALGQPLHYPGHPDAVLELTDARILAEAVEWAAATPAAHGEVFNVVNGDVVAWRDFWPRLAAFFGMPLGEAMPLELEATMRAEASTWDRIVAEHDLRPHRMDELIGLSWQYAAFLWANPRLPPRPILSSGIKIRRAGFTPCIDSEEMLLEHLRAMQDARLIPP